jgi:hypothetical protein
MTSTPPLLIALAMIILLATPSTAQCSDGDNCTCLECNVNGYSYFCSDNQECYSEEVECGFECSGSCTSTSNCALPVACSASQSSECSGECCLDSDANPFCALAGSVCCNYAQMTCTSGTVCDPPTGQCVTPATNYTAGCTACMKLVNNIESDGCSDVQTYCALLPIPFNAICVYAMNAGLCTTILNYLAGDLTPLTICEMIPLMNLCATGLTCECSYCQPAMYGNWCLALDATCPSSGGVARSVNHTQRNVGGRDICFDGSCDESNAGCCLTCAP